MPNAIEDDMDLIDPHADTSTSLADTPSTSVTSPPAVTMPPHDGPAPIEIVFSFDTTGSMSSCIEEVQNNLKTIINRLLMDIPWLKIAVISHGDYCDAEHFYVTKSLDFTNDVNTLFDFVTNCGGTGGGDYEECYELVLRKAREELSWTPGTTKSVVMIGDAIPHPPGHGGNSANLDWRDECDALYTQLGARVYAIQCLSDQNKEATPFWEELAARTHSKHLQLDQFESIVELMMAICYREGGHPDMFLAYEREIRAREGHGIRKDLDRMFNVLRDDTTSTVPDVNLVRGAARKPKATKHSCVNKTTVAYKKITYKNGSKRVNNTGIPKPGSGRKRRNTTSKVLRQKYSQKVQNRENVIRQHFLLDDLKWSPWKLYTNPTGYCNHKLYNHGRERSAIYEIAVQSHSRSKNYVVMFATTQGIRSGINWDSYIMRGDCTRFQMKCALEQGCNIVVRRAYLPKVYTNDDVKCRSHRQVAALLKRRYNYAWMRSSRNGQIGRDIVRHGKLLSQELEYMS